MPSRCRCGKGCAHAVTAATKAMQRTLNNGLIRRSCCDCSSAFASKYCAALKTYSKQTNKRAQMDKCIARAGRITATSWGRSCSSSERACARACACVRARVRACECVRAHARVRACACARACVRVRACVRCVGD